MSADVLAMIVVLYGEPDGHGIAPNYSYAAEVTHKMLKLAA